MSARAQVGDLEGEILQLKGSSRKVEGLTEKLDKRAENSPWWALLGDKAGETAFELAEKLHTLYGADEQIIDRIKQMLAASDRALDAVTQALQAGHGSSVENVAKAAVVLHEQAEIRPIENQLKQLRDDLDDQITKLG